MEDRGQGLLDSILKEEITEKQFIEELSKVQADIAVGLVKDYVFKVSPNNILGHYRDIAAKYPDFIQGIRDKIVIKTSNP